jgi:lactate permease
MAFIFALSPILLILVLMVIFRWGAARAGAAGYLWSLLVGLVFFGAKPMLLAFAHSKALLLTIDVLLIIWAAFLLYRVADEAGAIHAIGLALPHLTSDIGMQAIIIGWVFASFLQGVGGFGVPVAVIAPILTGLGFTPLAAVIIPSIGHGWAVTFGSLGSSFQALMAATGLPAEQLSPSSAFFLSSSGLLVGFMVVHAAAGWRSITRLVFPILIFGFVMGVVQFLVVVAGLWTIGSFCAGLAGLVCVFPLARRYRGDQNAHGPLDVNALIIALAGYVGLIVIVLAVQFIPWLNKFLGGITVHISFPELATSGGLLNLPAFVTPAGYGRKISLFKHTGFQLVYASILAYSIYYKAGYYKSRAINRILRSTLNRVLSPSISIASMVTMAVIMEHAGMTNILARGIAEGVGVLFPLFAPWIGAIGAFMTGSNTNSNVVFGALQLKTALLLGYNTAVILAGQTAGAALASVMAPTKVVVGASTAGMEGQEGIVIRRLIVYIGLLILFISLLTILGVLLF